MKKVSFLIFSLLCFINVYAEGEATLKNIKVNNTVCECIEYKCEMEVDSNMATITYELSDPLATVNRESGLSTSLTSEVTTINVEVTNGENHNIYEFVITKHVKSSDYSLSKLLLNEEEITLMKDVYVYNMAVPFDEENIIIEATPNDKKAAVDKELSFLFPIDESSKSFDFVVKAEDGTEKNYRIFVTRKAKPDTTLKSLKIDKGNINFDKDTLDYEIKVEYSVNDILIEAIPNDSKANVKITKESLEVGENTITIEVTNDNASSVYTLKVTREPNLDKSQANLSSLKISEYNNLDFDPNVLDYTLEFKEIPSVLIIDAKSISDTAKIEIIGNENLTNNSVVTIKVLLEDIEIERVYTLKIEEIKIVKNDDLKIIVAIIILIITIIILLILEIRDRNKKKKEKIKKDKIKKVEKVIKEENIIETKTKNTENIVEEIEEIEII